MRTLALGMMLVIAGCQFDPIPQSTSRWALGTLSYRDDPAVYRVGQTIPPNVPDYDGGTVSGYQLVNSPALPEGLGLNVNSGVISGVPLMSSNSTTYHVIASTPEGNVSDDVTITVNPALPPTNCHYTNDPATYAIGQAVSNSPTCGGDPVDSYSIVSSPLPSGLSLHPITGVVSGTPTTVSSQTNYAIRASNSGGSDDFTLTITVRAGDIIGTDHVIASGSAHTCAVVNGGVSCWGSNQQGRLGVGVGDTSLQRSDVPLPVVGLPEGVQAIATGTDHTCAIVNGGLWCWGNNGTGQLGDGSTNSSPVPVPVRDVYSGVQAVTAGAGYTCAIINGAAKCWGWNGYGQLGTGDINSHYIANQVITLTTGVQAIAAGGTTTCAIVNGGAQCWGNNSGGTLGNNSTDTFSKFPVQVDNILSGAQAITAGGSHMCALVLGEVRCWGFNNVGQIGQGFGSPLTYRKPAKISFPAGVQLSAANGDHTCAIVNGSAWCWGENSDGQLGNNTTDTAWSPVADPDLSSGIQTLGAGHLHGCALVRGALKCWGAGSWGQIGDGTYLQRPGPVQVVGLYSGVQSISSGFYHSCALVSGGVQCWGGNWVGQLGNGNTEYSLVPTKVQNLAGVQAIATGFYHSCAIQGADIWCWGYNDKKQLGDGSTSPYKTAPSRVLGPSGSPQAIAAGGNHTCAVIGAGSVYCWGSNAFGQIGNNSYGNSTGVTKVNYYTPGDGMVFAGVTAIAAGQNHSCAVANGRAWCWGHNGYGQLGVGTTAASYPFAVRIENLPSVRDISTGTNHTCALKDGAVYCWGNNPSGQIGSYSVGIGESARTPVQAMEGNVQAIASGNNHTCALSNGRVFCWGSNSAGQLGISRSFIRKQVPNLIQGLIGVQAITAKGDTSCAFINGRAHCWGSNAYGALGANASLDSEIPLPVSSWVP